MLKELILVYLLKLGPTLFVVFFALVFAIPALLVFIALKPLLEALFVFHALNKLGVVVSALLVLQTHGRVFSPAGVIEPALFVPPNFIQIFWFFRLFNRLFWLFNRIFWFDRFLWLFNRIFRSCRLSWLINGLWWTG